MLSTLLFIAQRNLLAMSRVGRKTRDMPHSLGVYTLRRVVHGSWSLGRACDHPVGSLPLWRSVSHLASKAQADALTIRRFTWVSAVSEPWAVRDAKEEDGY